MAEAIKETSAIKLEVDCGVVDETFHDSNDAWGRAYVECAKSEVS